MEALEDVDQLIIPKGMISPEAMESLESNGYTEIKSVHEFQELQAEMLYFSKMVTPDPNDIVSLEEACKSGMDILFPAEGSLDPKIMERIFAYDYSLAKETRAVLKDLQDGRYIEKFLPYYTKLYHEKLDMGVREELVDDGDRAGVDIGDYKVKYKSFLMKQQGKTPRGQKVNTELKVDIYGASSEPSILMEVSSFKVGTLKNDFLRDDEFFGFYPESVRMTIQPLWNGVQHEFVPSFVVKDQNLAEIPYDIIPGKQLEFSIQLGLRAGPISFQVGATSKDPVVATSIPSLEPVNEGENNACYVWKMQTWKDGKQYNADKPHKGLALLGAWPDLPYRGTGPIISGAARVAWNIPETKNVESHLTFEVSLQISMVLLQRRTLDCFGGVAFGGKSFRVEVSSASAMKLEKRI